MLKKNQPTGNPYIRLGKMPVAAARALKIKPCDIYVSDNNLRHIERAHSCELQKLGIPAELFVKLIAKDFNQIREGSKGSYLLIILNPNSSSVAAIEINYSLKREFVEIKTAIPMRMTEIVKHKLLWSK